MKRSAKDAGFTLAELLVATTLFAVALSGVHAVQTTAFKGQSVMMRKAIVENNATVVGAAIRDAIAKASVIARPANVGDETTDLLILENVNPSDGVSPLLGVPLAPSFNYICADASDTIHFYRGDLPVPAIVCGQAPPAGIEKTFSVGKQTSLRVLPTFARSARNAVYVEFEVRYNNPAGNQPITVKHSTQINTQNAAN